MGTSTAGGIIHLIGVKRHANILSPLVLALWAVTYFAQDVATVAASRTMAGYTYGSYLTGSEFTFFVAPMLRRTAIDGS